MSSLGVRALSAIVALLLNFACFYFFGEKASFILIYIAISISQFEYLSLALPNARRTLKFGFLASSQYFLLHCLPIPFLPNISPVKLALQFFVFICFFGLFSDTKEIKSIRNDIFATCFGFIYLGIIPGILSLTFIKNSSHVAELFGFLLITVFAGDVMAYFSGLLLGNKKILPLISPKKTIVGCVGGLIGSILFGTTYAYFLLPDFSLAIIGLCFLMGVYAQTGDFLESLIKRLAGKKDSGKIMPGHGGFLDRIDGVLFAIPALYFFYF